MSTSSDIRLRFGFQLVYLARLWRRALDSRLAQSGLTDATWSPLVHLHESGDGVTQKELALRLGLDGSTLVRLLDILASRQLIERREDERDRRAKRIFLTAEGRQAITDIRLLLWEIEQELLSEVSEADLQVTTQVMDQIHGRVQFIIDAQQGQK